MAIEPDDGPIEAGSTVSEEFGTTIPAEVREALDGLEPGDRVRWVVEDGELRVRIVRERPGAFDTDPRLAGLAGASKRQ